MQPINRLPERSKLTTENGNKRRNEVYDFLQSGAQVAKLKRIEPELPAQKEASRYKGACYYWARREFEIELEFHYRQNEVFVCRSWLNDIPI